MELPDMPRLAMQQEAVPTIVVECHRDFSPVGQQYRLRPRVHIQEMPGGWATAHAMLLEALGQVHGECLKEAQQHAPRVVLAQGLTNGMHSG